MQQLLIRIRGKMTGILTLLSLAAFMLLSACDTGSSSSKSASISNGSGGAADSGSGDSGGSGSLDPGPTTDSKFDVMVTDYLNTAQSGLLAGREAIAIDADKADVLEDVSVDIWLKSSSTDYAKYFKSDGTMQEKTTGNAYIAKWYAYEEGAVATAVNGVVVNASRHDRAAADFVTNTFGSSGTTKQVTVVLRIYEPGTQAAAMGAAKEGLQDWTITVSKVSTAAPTWADLKVGVSYTVSSSELTDFSVAAASKIDPLAASSSLTYDMATGSGADGNHFAFKLFTLDGLSGVFIHKVLGSRADASKQQVSFNTVLDSGAGSDAWPKYSDNVRADVVLPTVASDYGIVVLQVFDKYARTANLNVYLKK